MEERKKGRKEKERKRLGVKGYMEIIIDPVASLIVLMTFAYLLHFDSATVTLLLQLDGITRSMHAASALPAISSAIVPAAATRKDGGVRTTIRLMQ